MHAINAFEAQILIWLQSVLGCPFLDAVAKALSWLGDHGRVFILLAVILLCFKKTRVLGAVLALALILDLMVVNMVIKPLVARIRPYDFDSAIRIIIAPPGDFSFPSGHTAVAFAAAASLGSLCKKARVPAFAFASLMGLSRIYLMVHYPSDVLAGAVLGSLCGLLAVFLWKMFENRDKIKG